MLLPRIILSHPTHTGNIGATARAMKTMGFSSLHLLNAKTLPDQLAYSMASGANDILDTAVICDTLSIALHDVVMTVGFTARQRALSHPLLDVRSLMQRILPLQGQQIAFLFGTENSGLSNKELDSCQLLAYIPSETNFSSLNLAQAVQIVCYEYRMAFIKQPSVEMVERMSPSLADHQSLEGFYQHLEETLIKIGYFDPQTPKKLMTRLRRLYARASLEKEEVNILRGVLKSVQKLAEISSKS